MHKEIRRRIKPLPSALHNNRWFRIWLLTFAGLALFPGIPSARPLPGSDAGVYLYIGRAILHGQVPYRDIWDHKPPLIHYLNAVGLWLGLDSRWGIWLLALIALIVAVWCSLHLLQDAFKAPAALGGVVLWLATAGELLGDGNRPELFALLCQWAALLLFWQAWQRPTNRRLLAIGALGGIAALAKYNLVSLWLALLVVWFVGQHRRRGRRLAGDLARIAGGGGAVVLLALLFMAVQGALPAMLDATIRYNLVYAEADLGDRLVALGRGLFLTTAFGLAPMALIGLLSTRRRRVVHPLVLVALIDLPFSMLLITLPGQTPAHYYIPWLPGLTLLAASAIAATRPDRWWPAQWRIYRLVLLVIFILAGLNAARLVYRHQQQAVVDPRQDLVTFLAHHTDANSAVLAWDIRPDMPAILVAAERRTVAHYIYQHPLFNPDYTDEAALAAELSANQNQFPDWIIDTWQPVDGHDPDFGRKLFWQWGQRHNQRPTDTLQTVMNGYSHAYRPVTLIANRWIIYERIQKSQVVEAAAP